MKKALFFVSLGLAAALALTACSNSKETTEATPPRCRKIFSMIPLLPTMVWLPTPAWRSPPRAAWP